MVKGVDLFDGHLVVQREDLSYPGRGVPLRFARTYTSNNSGEPSVMGGGWSHSYMVKLVVTPCGEVTLIGGDGSGQRFIDVGLPELQLMKGYHGSLLANCEAKTFDFYSKDGSFRSAEEVGKELEGLGRELYNELFPKDPARA